MVWYQDDETTARYTTADERSLSLARPTKAQRHVDTNMAIRFEWIQRKWSKKVGWLDVHPEVTRKSFRILVISVSNEVNTRDSSFLTNTKGTMTSVAVPTAPA